jgi:hypothetical protein
MKEFLENFLYVHSAEEHRPTRILLTMTMLAIGWSFAGILHGLGVLGF